MTEFRLLGFLQPYAGAPNQSLDEDLAITSASCAWNEMSNLGDDVKKFPEAQFRGWRQ